MADISRGANGLPAERSMRSLIGSDGSCQGALSLSARAAGGRGVDNAALSVSLSGAGAPSTDRMAAKKPLSQASCSGVKGALGGIRMRGGGSERSCLLRKLLERVNIMTIGEVLKTLRRAGAAI